MDFGHTFLAPGTSSNQTLFSIWRAAERLNKRYALLGETRALSPRFLYTTVPCRAFVQIELRDISLNAQGSMRAAIQDEWQELMSLISCFQGPSRNRESLIPDADQLTTSTEGL